MKIIVTKEVADKIEETTNRIFKRNDLNHGLIDIWDAEEKGLDAICQSEYSLDFTDLAIDILGKEITHPLCPKVYKYAKDQAHHKHFHDLDYKKDLTTYLQPKEIFGTGSNKGLLVGMEWYSDQALTDLVLVMSREYVAAPYVGLISKWTSRRWVMNNGDLHPLEQKKDAPYKYTQNESRTATERRRSTIITNLKESVSGILQGTPYADAGEMMAALDLGAEFLDEIAPLTNSYIESGRTNKITSYVNTQSVQDKFVFLTKQTPYPGNPLVKDVLIGALTY